MISELNTSLTRSHPCWHFSSTASRYRKWCGPICLLTLPPSLTLVFPLLNSFTSMVSLSPSLPLLFSLLALFFFSLSLVLKLQCGWKPPSKLKVADFWDWSRFWEMEPGNLLVWSVSPQSQTVTRPTWKTDFFKSWWYFMPLRSWHINVDQGNILIYKKDIFLLANEFASSYFVCCLLLANHRQMHSNRISAFPEMSMQTKYQIWLSTRNGHHCGISWISFGKAT